MQYFENVILDENEESGTKWHYFEKDEGTFKRDLGK
jgi:hypothetical protein